MELQPVRLMEDQDFITLGHLLKSQGIIDTGGQIKWFLSEHIVMVNDEPETRRGRKLRAGDEVTIDGYPGAFLITEK